jgi:hypothetical protein
MYLGFPNARKSPSLLSLAFSRQVLYIESTVVVLAIHYSSRDSIHLYL